MDISEKLCTRKIAMLMRKIMMTERFRIYFRCSIKKKYAGVQKTRDLGEKIISSV